MKGFTILHLSDLHIGEINVPAFVRLRDYLCCDAFEQVQQKRLDVDAVVLTGDVVDRGGNADCYNNAYEFIEKLASKLGISLDKFIVVPGNHDVPRLALPQRTVPV